MSRREARDRKTTPVDAARVLGIGDAPNKHPALASAAAPHHKLLRWFWSCSLPPIMCHQ